MRLIELKCPHCSSSLRLDENSKQAICDYCGAGFVIDDETQYGSYDDAEKAGYAFEKGRQKAQSEIKTRLQRIKTNVDDSLDSDLLLQATALVVKEQKASTELIKQNFNIGFTECVRVLEALEERKIVGPYVEGETRSVLMTKSQYEEKWGPLLFMSPQKRLTYNGDTVYVENNKLHAILSKKYSLGVVNCSIELAADQIVWLKLKKPSLLSDGQLLFGFSKDVEVLPYRENPQIMPIFGNIEKYKRFSINFRKQVMPLYQRFIVQIGNDLNITVENI